MTVLGALTRRESRSISSLPWGPWPGEEYGPTWSGATVTPSTSLQLLTVYGCVRLICDQIATLPLDVLRKRADGSREEISKPDWLVSPVVGLPMVAWLSQVLSSLLLNGNAYVAVMRSEGRIVELIPLDATQVSVRREQGRKVVTVNGVTPAYDVLHIPGLMLAGSDVGFSPIEAARQSIGLGMAAQEFGARYFGQGAVLSGVIETPGELPPDKAKQMAKDWGRAHNGKAKSHLPGVLQGGATWKPTSVTNEQAQFLETRGYTASEIAGQLFLLDPSDLGLPVNGTSLTYANLQERNNRRFQVALLPWIIRVETALSGLLAQPRYVKFNPEGLLRGNQQARFEAYAVGISNKFMVPNEARELEDMGPLEGGDEVVTQAAPPEPVMDEEPRSTIRSVERDEMGQVLRVVETRA